MEGRIAEPITLDSETRAALIVAHDGAQFAAAIRERYEGSFCTVMVRIDQVSLTDPDEDGKLEEGYTQFRRDLSEAIQAFDRATGGRLKFQDTEL